jgi:uncharacterized protein YdeI (YjbR/CyaY-like superfamily)
MGCRRRRKLRLHTIHGVDHPLSVEPSFFKSPAEFRGWLERNHDSAEELLLGLHKKGSGYASITLREAQVEALCFGWIDGKARTIDENSWAIRFTPRRTKSVWSAININRAEALIAEGRMTPAGLAEFEKRDEKRVRQYSYERENPKFDAVSEAAFRANPTAWDFFRAQPAGYQRLHTWWVMSAKRDETRVKRLAALIEISGQGRRIDPMNSPYSQHTKINQTSLLTPCS